MSADRFRRRDRPIPSPGSALADLPARWRLPILAALGAVSALGQVPWGLFPLTVVALALLISVLARPGRWGAAAWSAWAFATGQFLVTWQWLVNPFYVEADVYGWMAPFAVAFMAGGIALFWALAGALAARRGGLWSTAALLGLAEVGRSKLFTGFPWSLPSQIWIDTPLAQAAAWIGPFGLTAATLALAASLAAAARGRPVPPLIALALLPPLWLVLQPSPSAATGPLVRIVQPNAPQDEKFDPDRAVAFHERALALSGEGPAAALTVWPETSIPWLLEHSEGDFLREIREAAGGAPVVVGIRRRDGSRYYNTLALIGEDGFAEAIYDKHHLVPFGEYVPLGELAARFGIRGLAAADGGGYAAGPGPATLELPGIGRALALICYEGLFAAEVNSVAPRPDLMLLATNDAWFGEGAGPRQHLAEARARAIEQGLPLVRSANTGISAMIDARGRITGALPLGQAGALVLPLPEPLPPTLYRRTGDWPALLLLGLVALAGLSRRPA